MSANESQKSLTGDRAFQDNVKGVFINIACPRQLKTLTWVDWCDHDLAMHLVASSHPDVDGGGLDCTRIGIQQERIAGC